MIKESKNSYSLPGKEIKSSGLTNPEGSRLSRFMERLYSINGLHFVAAISQIFLGLCVVTLSLIGAIQPLWLSTIMTVLGSSTAVIGIILLIHLFRRKNSFGTLIKESVRRVIEAQN